MVNNWSLMKCINPFTTWFLSDGPESRHQTINILLRFRKNKNRLIDILSSTLTFPATVAIILRALHVWARHGIMCYFMVSHGFLISWIHKNHDDSNWKHRQLPVWVRLRLRPASLPNWYGFRHFVKSEMIFQSVSQISCSYTKYKHF